MDARGGGNKKNSSVAKELLQRDKRDGRQPYTQLKRSIGPKRPGLPFRPLCRCGTTANTLRARARGRLGGCRFPGLAGVRANLAVSIESVRGFWFFFC